MKIERYLIKNNVKKFVEICIFPVFLLVGFMFLTGFYYESNINNNIKIDDIKVELGDKLPDDVVSYTGLLINDDNYTLESNTPTDEEGHTNKIGKYSYYLVYNDDDYRFSRFTNVKSTITVVDTVKPKIKIEDNIKIEYGHSFSLSDIAKCIDLSSCKMALEEEVDTTKSGDYEVTIIAIDEGNNISYAKAKITVLEKPKPVITYRSYQLNIPRNTELNSNMTEEEKNNLRNTIVEFAKQFVGNPYVYGGTSLTNGTDCSGFTMSVYGNFGYSLPRSAGSYPYVGMAVSESEALPGDIVVYHGHVGLYAGNGLMVHASTPQRGIRYEAVYNDYHTYRRIIY